MFMEHCEIYIICMLNKIIIIKIYPGRRTKVPSKGILPTGIRNNYRYLKIISIFLPFLQFYCPACWFIPTSVVTIV